eukprot:3537537-Rhodomonas_salina.4
MPVCPLLASTNMLPAVPFTKDCSTCVMSPSFNRSDPGITNQDVRIGRVDSTRMGRQHREVRTVE